MRTRSSWIWCWIVVAVLASGAGAQQYTTIIDNLPTCTGNRNGRVISVSDAVSDADCTEGGATGEDRFVHPCICDTLNALGPYWKAVGGGSGGTGDVVGPESSTDNAIARFDSTTGKLVQNSGVTLSDGRAFEATDIKIGNVASNASVYISSDNRVGVYVAASNQIFGWKKNGATDWRTGMRADGSLIWVSSGDPYNTENADVTLFRSAAGVVGVGGTSTSVGAALHLVPLASPPRTCDATAEGDIYSDTSHALCWCDASTWQKLSGAGTCA